MFRRFRQNYKNLCLNVQRTVERLWTRCFADMEELYSFQNANNFVVSVDYSDWLVIPRTRGQRSSLDTQSSDSVHKFIVCNPRRWYRLEPIILDQCSIKYTAKCFWNLLPYVQVSNEKREFSRIDFSAFPLITSTLTVIVQSRILRTPPYWHCVRLVNRFFPEISV